MFGFKSRRNSVCVEYGRLLENVKTVQELFQKEDSIKVKSEYCFPSINFLEDVPTNIPGESNVEATHVAETLEAKLLEFGIMGKVLNAKRGPVITRYEIQLGKGVCLDSVRKRADDISIALMGSIRILAPIPGTSLVGIEIANKTPVTIGLKNILKTYKKDTIKIPFILGVDTVGHPKILDLTTMPHLLISGTTGSGKSVCINNLILSILYTLTPEECDLVLVDPKQVEMYPYKNVPHVKRLITEPEEALNMFGDLIKVMEKRYAAFVEARAKSIETYNLVKPKLPYIVVIVDEMSDLMLQSGKELENLIIRIAQMGRAAGIHLVLATQKPIVKVITGLIKSNIPTRISFKVSSALDSRIILDNNGAERLIGQGDMLVAGISPEGLERFQGAFVTDKEIFAVTDFLTAKTYI